MAVAVVVLAADRLVAAVALVEQLAADCSCQLVRLVDTLVVAVVVLVALAGPIDRMTRLADAHGSHRWQSALESAAVL